MQFLSSVRMRKKLFKNGICKDKFPKLFFVNNLITLVIGIFNVQKKSFSVPLRFKHAARLGFFCEVPDY